MTGSFAVSNFCYTYWCC